jgi:ABC-type Na+ efflux pump permease subunit
MNIMYNKSLTIAVVAAVAIMLAATSAVATEDAFATKKKEYNQATSQANACGNGFMPINIGCQNTDSQIQGDENGVAQTAQQTFSEVDNGHDRGHERGD